MFCPVTLASNYSLTTCIILKWQLDNFWPFFFSVLGLSLNQVGMNVSERLVCVSV